MENLYAVYGDSSIFAIIKASSEQEAETIFAENQISDPYLREEIDSFIVNAGLLSEFYEDEHGSFFDDYTGDFPERLKKMPEEDMIEYINYYIKKNAQKFWQDTPHHAFSYLEELEKNRVLDDYSPSFSKDFYIDTIKLLVRGGDWYKDFAIVKVDLSKNNFQIIYND